MQAVHVTLLFAYCMRQRYVSEVDKLWRRNDLRMENPLHDMEMVPFYKLAYHGKNDKETFKKLAEVVLRYVEAQSMTERET